VRNGAAAPEYRLSWIKSERLAVVGERSHVVAASPMRTTATREGSCHARAEAKGLIAVDQRSVILAEIVVSYATIAPHCRADLLTRLISTVQEGGASADCVIWIRIGLTTARRAFEVNPLGNCRHARTDLRDNAGHQQAQTYHPLSSVHADLPRPRRYRATGG